MKILLFVLAFILSFLNNSPRNSESSRISSISLKFPNTFLMKLQISSCEISTNSNIIDFSSSLFQPLNNNSSNCLENSSFSCYFLSKISSKTSMMKFSFSYSLNNSASFYVEIDIGGILYKITTDHSQRIKISNGKIQDLDDLWNSEDSLGKKLLIIELGVSSNSMKSIMNPIDFLSSLGSLFFLFLWMIKSTIRPIYDIFRCQKALNSLFSLEFAEKKRKNIKEGSFERSFFDISKKLKHEKKLLNISLSTQRVKSLEKIQKGLNFYTMRDSIPKKPSFNQIKPKILPQECEMQSEIDNSHNSHNSHKKQHFFLGNSIAVAESEKFSIRDLKIDQILTSKKKPQFSEKSSMNLSLILRVRDYFFLFLRNFGLKFSNKRLDLFLSGRKRLLEGLEPLKIYKKLEEFEKFKQLMLDQSQLRVFNEYLRTFRVVLNELEENKKVEFVELCKSEGFSNFSFNMELIRSFRVLRERERLDRLDNNTVDRKLMTLMDGEFLNAMEKMNFE